MLEDMHFQKNEEKQGHNINLFAGFSVGGLSTKLEKFTDAEKG